MIGQTIRATRLSRYILHAREAIRITSRIPDRSRKQHRTPQSLGVQLFASGPKQTWSSAPRMSAFEGKADIACCGRSAFAVAIRSKADMGCCTAYVCL